MKKALHTIILAALINHDTQHHFLEPLVGFKAVHFYVYSAHLLILGVFLLEKLLQIWQDILIFLKGLLPSYTFALKAEDLEKKMTQAFPIKIKKLIFVFKITDPVIILPKGSVDRIGIGMSIKVSIPGLLSAKGNAVVEGEVDYDPDQGEFFFFDPEIKEMDIHGLPRRYGEEVRGLFEGIIRSTLGDMSIFKFDQDDKKQKIAKRFLKSVKVKDERLMIQVGF